ncbi:MAG: PaaI family thioesterase [Cumulibacter sp.]
MAKIPRTGYRALSAIDTESLGNGQARGTVVVTEDHLNRSGIMHGGALATLADSALGRAVATALETGQAPSTASMTMSYMASANPGDALTCMATVRKRGRQTAVVEADVVRDSDERLIAHAVATFVIVTRRSDVIVDAEKELSPVADPA